MRYACACTCASLCMAARVSGGQHARSQPPPRVVASEREQAGMHQHSYQPSGLWPESGVWRLAAKTAAAMLHSRDPYMQLYPRRRMKPGALSVATDLLLHATGGIIRLRQDEAARVSVCGWRCMRIQRRVGGCGCSRCARRGMTCAALHVSQQRPARAYGAGLWPYPMPGWPQMQQERRGRCGVTVNGTDGGGTCWRVERGRDELQAARPRVAAAAAAAARPPRLLSFLKQRGIGARTEFSSWTTFVTKQLVGRALRPAQGRRDHQLLRVGRQPGADGRARRP